MKRRKPKRRVKLDEFEKQLEKEIARGEWIPVKNRDEMVRILQETARKYLAEQKSIKSQRKKTVNRNSN